jgi:hypothetical protein
MKKDLKSQKMAANSSVSKASPGDSFNRRLNEKIEKSSKENSRRSVREKR